MDRVSQKDEVMNPCYWFCLKPGGEELATRIPGTLQVMAVPEVTIVVERIRGVLLPMHQQNL